MDFTTKKNKVRILSISTKRGGSGYYFARSDDIKGLVVSAKTVRELDQQIPKAIMRLLAADGVRVMVAPVDNSRNSPKQWIAMPAEIAKKALQVIDELSGF